jgi:hypothetical protein
VAVVTPVSGTSERSGVEKGLRKVDLNKVPTGPKSAGWTVGDEEEAVMGSSDCSEEGSAGGRRRQDQQRIRRKHRDSCGGRNRSDRDGKWERSRSSSVVVEDISKLKQRRVVGS